MESPVGGEARLLGGKGLCTPGKEGILYSVQYASGVKASLLRSLTGAKLEVAAVVTGAGGNVGCAQSQTNENRIAIV